MYGQFYPLFIGHGSRVNTNKKKQRSSGYWVNLHVISVHAKLLIEEDNRKQERGKNKRMKITRSRSHDDDNDDVEDDEDIEQGS